MLIGFGDYTISFAVTGQSGSGAAFLTDSAGLNDGRSGTGAVLRFTNGTMNVNSYVEVTATLVSALDASARQGVAGLINLQGARVTAGLKTIIAGITQRLVAGARGELSAWVLPATNSNTCVFRIYNDDGTVTPPLQPADEIFIGEFFAGRCVDLCTLIGGQGPSDDLQDPTAYQRTAGGQLHAVMRKPYRVMNGTLGLFTTAQARGGLASNLPDGGGGSGTMDIQWLRDFLSTSAVCAICDIPTRGLGDYTLSNGIKYDQSMMQNNWRLARPTNPGQLSMSKPPKWQWTPTWQEAT